MRTRSVGVFGVVCAGVLSAVLASAGVGSGVSQSGSMATATREPVDLLYISDSSGWGVARFYAREVRKRLGAKVRVHDMWQPDLPAAAILARLRTKGDEWIALVREAEIVYLMGNPVGLTTYKGGNCVTDVPEPPAPARPRQWTRFIEAWKAIYARVFEIRSGRPVILRTGNLYAPAIRHAPNAPFFAPVSWEEAGLVEECTEQFEMFAWAISKAAAAYRVPVADVYTAFNGRSHLEDPVAKGYIQSDGIHPSNKGRAVIAKTLANLGYKPVLPR